MRKVNIGIIDFERKGNVVRFYMGDVNKDYHGEGWDSKRYEYVAGTVYKKYVDHVIDIAFPIQSTVLEPCDDWQYYGNSPFSKNDMKFRRVPCLIVVPDGIHNDCFSDWAAAEDIAKFYFGDSLEMLTNEKIRQRFKMVDMTDYSDGSEEGN